MNRSGEQRPNGHGPPLFVLRPELQPHQVSGHAGEGHLGLPAEALAVELVDAVVLAPTAAVGEVVA